MYRYAITLTFAALAVSTAQADVVDLFSSATWSFMNKGGSNGPNFAFTGGSQTSLLTFNLGAIPTGATINSATLTIRDVSTSWDFGFNAPNRFGCEPPPGPFPFFGQLSFCSDVNGAEFIDTVGVDGTVPNTCGPFDCTGPTQLFGFPPGTPEPVDPLAVTGASFVIPILASANMSFGAFDDFGSGTPPIPSFSISGFTDAELDVDFSGGSSELPEPAGYRGLLAGLLIPLAAVALRRRRFNPAARS